MTRLILASLLLFTSLITFSQEDSTNYVDPDYKAEKAKAPKQRAPFASRVYFGGTFGLGVGGGGTSLLLEPLVGFKMTEKLSLGLGLGIRYGSGKYTNGEKFTYTNYIGRVFARYIIIPKIYAHMEYMVESYDKIFKFDSQLPGPNNGRTNVPYLFVGGGYRSQAGKGSLIFQVLFNVLQNNENSAEIYPSGRPYISIGYIGGF